MWEPTIIIPYVSVYAVYLLQRAYIRAGFQHVVSVPARDGHEGHSVRVITNLLDVSADFLHNLLITLLAIVGLSGIHFVDAHDELLHSQRVGKQGVFTSLPVLWDASFKLTHACSHDQHSTVGLQEQKRREKSIFFLKYCSLYYVFVFVFFIFYSSAYSPYTWEVPVIMFLMKSLCPGASMMVT